MRPWLAFIVAGLALLATCTPASATAQACTTTSGCTDCVFNESGGAECSFVARSGSCECTVTVAYHRTACGQNGVCTYSSGGGTGGGGAGGGGSASCTRLPGGWCPSECSSCETVYWN